MNTDELARIVEKSAIDRDGAKRMPCAIAFELAENYPVTLLEIGESCNRQGIKIAQCQLGCFK